MKITFEIVFFHRFNLPHPRTIAICDGLVLYELCLYNTQLLL